MSNNLDTRLLDNEEKKTLANLLWRYFYEKKMLNAIPNRYRSYEKLSYEDECKERNRRVAGINDAFSILMYELEIYDGVDVYCAVEQKEDIPLVKTR
jgi:hypothetical protein|nr:MAG TPA: hypothetical protein [Caudoviricetes sp.]